MPSAHRRVSVYAAALAAGLVALCGAAGCSSTSASGRTLTPARGDQPVPVTPPRAASTRPVLASGDSLGRAMFEAPVAFASRIRAERRYAGVATDHP